MPATARSDLELEIFERLCAMALAASDDLRAAAHAFALLDVATALAKLAVDDNYVRPDVDGSLGFAVEGGRHPVVEQALKRDGQPFIANACDLSPGPAQKSGQIWLITGPNMAGKSTFLRQNALIALMAQIGSYVPASRARIGVVDRLFSRVGAADDLARGRSTFMVEMVETAVILNQASERSLVILDEIGRGTATFDGLSIAWAAIEHLHEANRCRALFATHYHELTALSAKLPRMFNATVRVKEWQGDVVFLHEVLPGSADRSYGIQVAKLAGLPPAVIARAKSVLAKLEAQDRGQTARALADDLPLFAVPSRAAAEAAPPSEAEQMMEAVKALHPDFSIATATPWPTPTHMVARASFPPRFSMPCTAVNASRAPLMPSGWPSAIAPPCGLTKSASSLTPSCRKQAMPCEAKASLSSIKSKSEILMPSRSISFFVAGTGPMPMMRGGTAADASPRMRARGVSPCFFTAASEARIIAAAPSLTPDALPAVTVPGLRTIGFNFVRPSSVVSGRGCSSLSTMTGPALPPGTDTGVISSAK